MRRLASLSKHMLPGQRTYRRRNPGLKLLALITLALGFFAFLPGVLGQEIAWIRQFGTASDDDAYAVSAYQSRVYTVGGCCLGAALPGQIGEGGSDAFVRLYYDDTGLGTGTELWTRQFGTPYPDSALGVFADPYGVYVTGYTSGALPEQTSAGGSDAFVRMYDHFGNLEWTHQFGTGYRDEALGVSADRVGVYVVGWVGGGALPGFPGQTNSGYEDAFLRKVDRWYGMPSWTRQFGTSGTDSALGVFTNASGIYVVGYASGALPGQIGVGNEDAFLRKYDVNGNEIWTRQFGTPTHDRAFGVSGNASGIYVVGYSYGALPDQTSAGGSDVFVRKYDIDGNVAWTRQFGTGEADVASQVSSDSSGVYVSGTTWGVLPGQTSLGGSESFVRKYDDGGNELWTRQFGTGSGGGAFGVSAGSYGVYVTGYSYGSFQGQTSAGFADAFLAKMGAPANTPPTAEAGGPYAVDEGSSVTVTASGSDPGGGSLTYAWDMDNNGIFEAPGQTASFSATALDGPTSRTIQVQVTDSGGLTATAQATVNVNNVAPVIIGAIGPSGPIAVGAEANVAANFTDVGTSDTHDCTFSWGDGAGSSSPAPGTGNGSCTSAHAYASAGVYTVQVEAKDDDAGTATLSYEYIVVYDPNAGFVTGGGWIDSPVGAYTPDPTLTGRAAFGFISKYQKGATTPTGMTEFQFKVAGLNFHSDTYEWLVVAGAKAQYKGSGTVNGTPGYGFLLTVTDGQISGGGGVDKFRIKIQNKVSGDVVYDNVLSGSEDLSSANPQEIAGGSIVIHSK